MIPPWCRVINSSDDVLLEPTGLARKYPRKRPADIAIRLLHTLYRILGFDFTIAGTPKAAASTKNQKRKNSFNLRAKEILKWQGTTRSKPNETNENGTPHAPIQGKDVIKNLLQNDVLLVPAAFDPFMAKDTAFCRYVDRERPRHQFSRADFGTRAAGADVGYRMSQASRQSHIPPFPPF